METWYIEHILMIAIQKLSAKNYSVLAGVADGFQPDPNTSVALLAAVDNEIVGRIFLLAPTHIEGPWIRADHRNGILAKRLVDSAAKEAKECGITKLFAYGVDETIECYLERLGFEKLRMTVWSKEI